LTRLVLADAQPIVLEGLEHLFGAQADFHLLARCCRGNETLAAVREHHPDVLVLDPHLPDPGGRTLLRLLRDEHPATKVVLFAAWLSDDEAIEALGLGVRGIVLKHQPPEQLVQVVRETQAGGRWIETSAAGQAWRLALRQEADAAGPTILTPRELEMARMVAHGLCNQVIAERLLISPGTVKVHLHHVYRKLKLAGRIELMLYARQMQMI